MMQLVQAKRFGEDIDDMPICWNIHKFDFTRENSLAEKVIMYVNVLHSGVEDGVLGELDVAEVVVIYHGRFGHLYT